MSVLKIVAALFRTIKNRAFFTYLLDGAAELSQRIRRTETTRYCEIKLFGTLTVIPVQFFTLGWFLCRTESCLSYDALAELWSNL